jgi:hypothetical protein
MADQWVDELGDGGRRPSQRGLSWNAMFLSMSKKGNMVIFRKN